MASNNTAIIIIGMVLIVGLVMYGPVTMDFGNFLQDAWDNWGTLFGDEGGASAQTVGVGVKLYYADGTTEEYEPKDAHPLMPLTVVLGEKEVNSIEFSASCKILYTGELNTISATGTFSSHTRPAEISIKSEPFTKTITNPSASGTWFNIAQMTVSASEIENAVYHDGMVSVMGVLDVTELKITTASGEAKTFSGNTESGITLWVTSTTVQSVSLEVNTNILYAS